MTAHSVTPASFTDVEPIFVVGAPRSGTTLLQLILNAHPDIAMNGEVHYFDQVLQLRKLLPDLRAEGALARLFKELRRVDAFRYLPALDEQLRQVRQQLEQASEPSYEAFLRFMLEAPARARGVARFGEKTPQNIRYLHELKAIFPAAKIVHIVRDPRDVVSSLLQMPWASKGVLANAVKWKIDMVFLRDFQVAGHSLHELKYEDLLERPEATLRALCSYIGVSWTPAMLEFHATAHREIKDEPWKKGTAKELNASARGRWQKDLSPADVQLIQLAVQPFLTHHGYAPAPVSVGRRLALPVDVAADLARFLRGRSDESARRMDQAPDTIFGEEARLWSKLREALLAWRV